VGDPIFADGTIYDLPRSFVWILGFAVLCSTSDSESPVANRGISEFFNPARISTTSDDTHHPSIHFTHEKGWNFSS
jgi:hypothetical protein